MGNKTVALKISALWIHLAMQNELIAHTDLATVTGTDDCELRVRINTYIYLRFVDTLTRSMKTSGFIMHISFFETV